MPRRVTALNNHGVKSLQAGHFHEAILSFRHAIEIVNASVSHSKHCLHEQVIEDSCNDDLVLIRCPVEMVKQSDLEASSPYNMFDMFQSIFSLKEPQTLQGKQCELSVVLFYNLAVACHLTGLVRQENSSHYLFEAHRFYKLSLSVFKSKSECNLDRSQPLVLGILTNLGHLFSHSWRIDEAQLCRNHLETLLFSNAMDELLEDEINFFVSAITYASKHDCILAPAA